MNKSEVGSFHKIYSAVLRLLDNAQYPVFWVSQNALVPSLRIWFSNSLISKMKQLPKWAHGYASTSLVAAHWIHNKFEFMVELESRRENNGVLLEEEVFKSEPWGDIVGWEITRRLVIQVSPENGNGIKNSLFPLAQPEQHQDQDIPTFER